MTTTLVVTCLAILAASVLGGMVPLATVLDHTRLQVYLSFSAGAMLGAAFFHMLPEAARVGSASTIPWAAVGLLALFFLERFFSFHHHEPPGHAHAAVINMKSGADHSDRGPHRCNQRNRRFLRETQSRGARPPLAWRFIRWSAAWPWRVPSRLILQSTAHGRRRPRRFACHARAQAGRCARRSRP